MGTFCGDKTRGDAMARKSGRNKEIGRGVNALGRSAASSKFKRFIHGKKTTAKVEKKEEPSKKQPRWYAADDIKKPLFSRKNRHKPTKLRSNITPGTILILLAGRFKGKRVVFLKQLESGLLLVTGPFKINGVPLRRVNQVYVISTSTKIDVSGVDVASVTDATFKKEKVVKSKKDGDEFFQAEEKKTELSQEKKDLQKKVDSGIVAAVAKVPNLGLYLNAKFSLTKNDKPHEMKF